MAGIVVVATGVRATPLAEALGIPQAPDGRVLVEPNLSIPAHPEVFAIGDMAALPTPDTGLHPALAQFAIQGGRHAAREIQRQLQGKPPRRFRYWDKGMTSIVAHPPGCATTSPATRPRPSTSSASPCCSSRSQRSRSSRSAGSDGPPRQLRGRPESPSSASCPRVEIGISERAAPVLGPWHAVVQPTAGAWRHAGRMRRPCRRTGWRSRWSRRIQCSLVSR
jgi:hypothetical protein